MSPQDEATTLLKQRRSRRQVLASLGLGAAALYVAPTLLSMDQAEAHERRHSRPSGHHPHRHSRRRHSKPSHSRPYYSRPGYSRPDYSRPEYTRNGYSRSPYHHHQGRPYGRDERSRWERDGVIELRISRLLPIRW
ncbi:hypothetical protein [Halomonas sp. SpR8]|uniref:hypothetical protein n=1 Tax=Halomonas sp. SpR8 TaxID=3050463 RepID=UPI0027E55528|nr:hypothetical protein [Halomonas sp. SpR8]MDQ7727629.1 hypothetical protein [Halomonas sp. SpR8]